MIEFVSDFANEKGFSEKRIKEIELAAEEALVNVFNYAYPEEPGEVAVICKLEDNSRFTVEISDSGVPFNVLSLPDPDLTSKVPERKIGGLGVFFIRKMTDEVRYRRVGDSNILILSFLNS